MFNLDPGKMAREAAGGLAEKLGGGAGEAAKDVLQGIKKVEKLAGLEKAPEQIIEVLRKLLAEAKQLTASAPGKNGALDTCIEKAQALLDSGDISTEAVTKLTAELGELLKGAGGARQEEAPEASRTAPPAPKAEPQPAAAAQRKAVEFSDVDPKAYYYDAVQWAVQQGITSGTSETTFSPDQECTCGQAISLLWRAAGSPAPRGQNNPFTDVKESAFYYQPAMWAAERGIVTGTEFCPDQPVTRGQFAGFLYRNAGSPAVAGESDFTDVPGDADYAKAVAWVAGKGIASGTGEHTFSPDAVCTRGQIVTFLYRAQK